MKLWKQIATTAMALTLVAGLASCSSEENAPSNNNSVASPESSAQTGTESTPQEENASEETTGDVAVYEEYFTNLNTQMAEFMTSAESLVSSVQDYIADPSNPDTITNYVSTMEEAASWLYAMADILAPEDMTALHEEMADAARKIGDAYVLLAKIYNTEDVASEIVQDQMNEIQLNMNTDLVAMEAAINNLIQQLELNLDADIIEVEAPEAEDAQEEAPEEAAG